MASYEDLTLSEVLAKYSEGPQDGIFTDGGSRPNPGPGGWGFVHVRNGEIVFEKHAHVEEETTNNRMEYTALVEAYKHISKFDEEITIYSDSNLAVQTVNQWAAGWERNGWKRKTGPIKNLELVQELYSLAQANPHVSLKWIKAHNGWLWNEYADSLATAWARSEL